MSSASTSNFSKSIKFHKFTSFKFDFSNFILSSIFELSTPVKHDLAIAVFTIISTNNLF